MNLKNKKILVISPHPDDEIIGCGGLIIKAKRENSEVFVLYVAIGACRQLVTGKTEEKSRLKETTEVAKYCRFKYKFIFIGDEFMRLDTLSQKDLVDPIEDTIQEFKPDIVSIPYQHSYDQDHRAVFNACITALRPRPKNVRYLVPTVIEYEEPYDWSTGDSFKPNIFLDLGRDIDKKVKALKLHKSQYREWPFSRSGENLKALASVRGKSIGIEYAEAYKLHRDVLE